MSEDRQAEPEGVGADDTDSILDDLLGIEPDEPEQPEPQEPQTPGEPQTAPTRAARRVSALRNRLKDQEDENRRLRADIDRMIAQTQQPVAPPVDPYRQAEIARQEQEQMAMMQPHQIAAYTEQKLTQRFSQQLLQGQLETRDLIDRQMYETLRARDKLADRFAPQVEQLLIAARRQNMNPTREILLNALVGQEVRQKSQQQAETARRRGARQLAAQTTQPGGSQSTAAGSNGRRANDDSDEAMIERLKNTTVGQSWG